MSNYKKSFKHVLAVIVTVLCVMGSALTPAIAEDVAIEENGTTVTEMGEESVQGIDTPTERLGLSGDYFDFKTWNMELCIGSSRKIEYDLGPGNEVTTRILSGEDVISFKDDVVTGVASGNAEIEYTDLYDRKFSCHITVGEGPTDFWLSGDEITWTIRPDEEGVSDNYGEIGYAMSGGTIFNDVRFIVLEGDCIQSVGEYSNQFKILKTGSAKVQAEINGIVKTATVTVKQGTYAKRFESGEKKYLLKTGDTLNLKEEINKYLISGTDSDDFSDELANLSISTDDYNSITKIDDDLALKAEREGQVNVTVTLVNGQTEMFVISVSNTEVKGIEFENKEYWIQKNNYGETWFNRLQTVPYFMSAALSRDDVHWKSSDHGIAVFNDENTGYISEFGENDRLCTLNEGTVIITAEWNGFTASATVHIIDADNVFYISESEYGGTWGTENIRLKKGESTKLKYVIGEGNYVVSKSVNNECVTLDSSADTITAVETGYTSIQYTDRFNNTIWYNVSVYEDPKTFELPEEKTICFRSDSASSYYIYPEITSLNAANSATVKWEVEGDSSLIKIEDANGSVGFSFVPLKSGSFTLRGTTENGLKDSCKVSLLEGNYVNGFDWEYNDRYILKPGETLDLHKIAFEASLPKNADISDEVFTYVIREGRNIVSVDDKGVLTAEKNGKATVNIASKSGVYKQICISVIEGINEITFEQSEYNFEYLNSYNGSSHITVPLLLNIDPMFAGNGINADEVTFTSSDSSILYLNYRQNSKDSIGAYFELLSPGEVTVTAEYAGKIATAKVKVYEPKEQTTLSLQKTVEIRKGFEAIIPYSFGPEEKTDCKLEILSGEKNVEFTYSDAANDNSFIVTGKSPGKAIVRVTSVDNPNLYKDIEINVTANADIDFNFTLKCNGEEVLPEKDRSYTLVYGEWYEYSMQATSLPANWESLYSLFYDSRVISSQGGAAGGFDGLTFGEYGNARAGKVGNVVIQLWPGKNLKFNIVSDYKEAGKGQAKVSIGNNSMNIDEAVLSQRQEELTADLTIKLDNDALNQSVTRISDSSETKIYISEVAEPLLDTETSVELSQDGDGLIYEITPVVRVTATSDDGSSIRVIGTEQTDISEAVDMELPTGDFIDSSKPVYIKHVKEDGTVHVYEGVYDPDTKTVKFTNPDGFSTFVITQVKPEIGEKPSSPTKPSVSDSSDTDPSNGVTESDKPAVDTADYSSLPLAAGGVAVSLAVIAGILFFRRRHA